ncbi:MAG: hypothetical protein COS85_20070, partial [Armatimonadetes bacterium CG07_land_8_20_14_0_80_59_28]
MQLRKWFQSPRRRNSAIFILLAVVGVVVYRVYAAPTITIGTPAGSSRINSDSVTYGLTDATGVVDESSKSKITWTRTGGTADLDSPHTYPLLAGDMSPSGSHTVADTTPAAPLVDGTIYTLTVSVSDGSNTSTATSTNVTFDTTPPELDSCDAGDGTDFVDVVFKEDVQTADAEDETKYALESPTGKTKSLAGATATYTSGTKTTRITGITLTAGNTFKVTVTGVKDTAGNAMGA